MRRSHRLYSHIMIEMEGEIGIAMGAGKDFKGCICTLEFADAVVIADIMYIRILHQYAKNIVEYP
jgi:hypothetical protein